jgi:hypothetical protein
MKFPDIAKAVDLFRAKGWKVGAVAAINLAGDETGAVDDPMRADLDRIRREG